MSTMIQIRNVPGHVHRLVKSRAALAGMSMSEYILREIQRSLERPTREELLERLRAYPSTELSTSPASMVREERERR